MVVGCLHRNSQVRGIVSDRYRERCVLVVVGLALLVWEELGAAVEDSWVIDELLLPSVVVESLLIGAKLHLDEL